MDIGLSHERETKRALKNRAQKKMHKKGFRHALEQFERENLYKDLKCTA